MALVYVATYVELHIQKKLHLHRNAVNYIVCFTYMRIIIAMVIIKLQCVTKILSSNPALGVVPCLLHYLLPSQLFQFHKHPCAP